MSEKTSAHLLIFGFQNSFGQKFLQLLNQKHILFTLSNSYSQIDEKLSSEILELAPSHVVFLLSAFDLNQGTYYFIDSNYSGFNN